MADSPSARTFAETATAVTLFGFTPVIIRGISANAYTIGVVRLGVASAAVFLFLAVRRRIPNVPMRTWATLALLGACFASHWLLYFFAIKAASASIASIGTATYGIHLIVLGWVTGHHQVRWTDLVALGLAVIGTLLLVPSFSLQNATTAGLGMAVVSAFFYACLPLLHQKNAHLGTTERTFGQYFFALLIFLVFLPSTSWALTTTDWLGLAFLTLISTLVAHTLWVRVTTVLPTVTTSVVYYFYVPVAVVMSYFVLGEDVSARMIAGGALVIGGNVLGLVARSRRRECAPAE